MRLFPDRPLTPMEIGMVLTVVLLMVMCCLGVVVTSLVADPAPVAPPPHGVPAVSPS